MKDGRLRLKLLSRSGRAEGGGVMGSMEVVRKLDGRLRDKNRPEDARDKSAGSST